MKKIALIILSITISSCHSYHQNQEIMKKEKKVVYPENVVTGTENVARFIPEKTKTVITREEIIESIKIEWQRHNRDNGLSWNEVAELVNQVTDALTPEPVGKCEHDFISDGGECQKCGKTWIEITDGDKPSVFGPSEHNPPKLLGAGFKQKPIEPITEGEIEEMALEWHEEKYPNEHKDMSTDGFWEEIANESMEDYIDGFKAAINLINKDR